MYSIINMVLDELLHRSSISVHAVDHSSSSGMLLFPKSTYQPSNMRRKRTHGFFARWLFLALTFGFIIGGFTLLISMYVNVINISQQSSYFTNRCFIVNTREIDHSNNCIHYCRIYKYYPYQCK